MARGPRTAHVWAGVVTAQVIGGGLLYMAVWFGGY